ncbi:MAG: hypothetical protein ACOH2B_04325 [Burkholderiaceae bacterium]
MQSETPAAPQPFVRCRKWIRNEGCLSEASSFISHFLQRTNGNPQGKSAVAFLLLTFLWRSKEK